MRIPSSFRFLTPSARKNHTRSAKAGRKQRPALSLDTLEDRTLPSAYVVTTTADSGPGSLRDAITQVNADTSHTLYPSPSNPSVDEIDFTITAVSDTSGGYNSVTGVATITPQSPLPTITNPVLINGFTQGYGTLLAASANTNSVATNGLPTDNAVRLITLDGSLLGSSGGDGLVIAGGNSTVQGLTIQHFLSDIHLATHGNDVIAGNYISWDEANGRANGYSSGGVFVDGVSNNTIGGAAPAARNLVVDTLIGITIEGSGATGNLVEGNYLGTDGQNQLNSAGSYGGVIVDASSNIIGGTAPGSGNVIDSDWNGLLIGGFDDSDNNNLVQGNYIGTDATGTKPLTDVFGAGSQGSYEGIWISSNANGNTIGGTTGAARNVISGYSVDLVLTGPGVTDNLVEGNYIGTDATGTKALNFPGGGSVGVGLAGDLGVGASGNVVGGSTPGSGNLISGNSVCGVSIAFYGNTAGNLIEGNLIGTDSTGTKPLPNGVGVADGGTQNVIGGTAPGAGNTIAYNQDTGVSVASTSDQIEGNSIHDNTGAGVELDSGATGDTVQGNSIHDNAGPGVWVEGDSLFGYATGDAIEGNSIYANGELGIALGDIPVDANGNQVFDPNLVDHFNPAGVIANTAGGPHVGANDLQNYPVLTAAESGSTLLVSGSLNSAANTTYTVDVYASPTVASTDFFQGQYYGEGQYYLGSTTVTTDGTGNVSFAADFSAADLPNEVLPAGWYISATATDPVGNTSEFSADVQAAASAQAFTQAITQSLQSAINTSSTPAVTLQLTPATAADVASAIAGVTVPQNTTASVYLILGPGNYTSTTVQVPAGMTLYINGTPGTVIDPASAAFTLTSGNVVVSNVTFITTGDAPTILVTGGSLTLRNDTIQESTGFSDPAIRVTGGTLDLGTAASPGGNTVNINGTGTFVNNTTSTPISAVGDSFTVNGQALTPSSLSGIVWEDFNNDGQVDFGEKGISGVTITLTGTDDLGNVVNLSQQTDGDGTYLFLNLRPGNYYLTETPPAGYLQGIDTVGTAGGSLVAADQFLVPLAPGANGLNYNFGEQPTATGAVHKGQTAGIGFWNNKNGQALIKTLNGGPSSTQLANWLAATLPHMFGVDAGSDNLTGQSNAYVAALFQQDFLLKGVKLDAQVLATALSVYATNATLDPTKVAAPYGFTVSGDGVGTAAVNVGSNGDAFGVANNTTMTVMDLLLATDAQAVNGVLYSGVASLRNHANNVYSALNGAGDIG